MDAKKRRIVERKPRDQGAELTGKRRQELEEVALWLNEIIQEIDALNTDALSEIVRLAQILETESINRNTQIKIAYKQQLLAKEVEVIRSKAETGLLRVLFALKDMGARIEPRWESHIYEDDI